MSVQQFNKTAYGLSQPLIGLPSSPIVSKRSPSTQDKAEIGTLWINTIAEASWILINIADNASLWQLTSSTSTTFTDILVTPGNITVSNGYIAADSGPIVGESIVATGDGLGLNNTTSMSNVETNAVSTGHMTILSTNANAGNSAGYLKFYIGTLPVWVPYFILIAP
jgi:hypothetical protein